MESMLTKEIEDFCDFTSSKGFGWMIGLIKIEDESNDEFVERCKLVAEQKFGLDVSNTTKEFWLGKEY